MMYVDVTPPIEGAELRRILDGNRFAVVNDFVDKHPSICGPKSRSGLLESIFEYQAIHALDPTDDQYVMYELSDRDGMLLGVIRLYYSDQQPSCFILGMHVIDDDWGGSALANLWREAIDAVRGKRLMWYTVMNIENYPKFARAWSTLDLPASLEHERPIPANTKPPYSEIFNVLMGRELQAEDLTLVRMRFHV